MYEATQATQKRYVVDTSVVIKWFSQIDEDNVDVALRLQDMHLKKQALLIAPDLLFYEVLNALRYNANLTDEDLAAAVASLTKMDFDVYLPGPELMNQAVKLARLHNATVYDASYVALAQELGCLCVMADEKLYRKFEGFPYIIPIRELSITRGKGENDDGGEEKPHSKT